MDILITTLVLAAIVCLFIYFSKSKDDKNSSIPYVTHGSYPIIGHLFPFLRDRTNFLIDCKQRYGSAFRIQLFKQRMTFVLSPSEWAAIIRNPSFHLPAGELGMQLFDISNDLSGKYEYLLIMKSIEKG